MDTQSVGNMLLARHKPIIVVQTLLLGTMEDMVPSNPSRGDNYLPPVWHNKISSPANNKHHIIHPKKLDMGTILRMGSRSQRPCMVSLRARQGSLKWGL